jgi:hypothetical protein
VSIPLIVFALNMEYCSAVYRELRHNHLARIGIRLIDWLLPPLPSANSNTYRKRWTERLQKDREEYVKNEGKDDTKYGHSEQIEGHYATIKDMKPLSSLLSTVSSRTLVDEAAATDYAASSRGSTRRYDLRRKKNMDSEYLPGAMLDAGRGKNAASQS